MLKRLQQILLTTSFVLHPFTLFSGIPEQVQFNCVAQVVLCNQIFYDVVRNLSLGT